MSSSISIEFTTDDFYILPDFSKESASWPSFKSIFAAIKEVWKEVEATENLPFAAFKASIIVLGGAARVALSVSCTSIGLFILIANFPFTLGEWTWSAAVDHAVAGTKELLVLFISILITNIYPIEDGLEERGKTPILLVHGYLSSPSAWFLHIENLKEAGIGPIYTIDLGSSLIGIDDYTQLVAEKVDAIRAKHLATTGEVTKVVLAGHSMGGFISTRFATTDQEDRIQGVITLGSPLQGSEMASYAFGPAAREMERNSRMTREINQGILNSTHIKFFHLAGLGDLIIRPVHSAHPSVSGPHIKKMEIDGCGHSTILHLDAVSDIMIKCYNEAVAV